MPITSDLAARLLPKRPDDSHKGSFGKALIIAGSRQFTGAAALAIRACLRSGAGLVYAAVPESIFVPLAAGIPEPIWFLLPERKGAIAMDEEADLEEKMGLFPTDGKDALLIGPGLGQSAETKTYLLNLLTHLRATSLDLPLVIDADALNLLSRQPDWHNLLPNQTVLTPHEMEFSRLTGLPLEEIRQNRPALASSCARVWHQTLILKGAHTLVSSPDGNCRVMPFANSALAHGGTGDVLAGLIAGLLAQGLAPFDAAALAVWLHARAAELALAEVGHAAAVLPSDLIQQLGKAMKSL